MLRGSSLLNCTQLLCKVSEWVQFGSEPTGFSFWTLLFDFQVIFELDGVFIHPSADEGGTDQDLLLSGSLRVLDKVRAHHWCHMTAAVNTHSCHVVLFVD